MRGKIVGSIIATILHTLLTKIGPRIGATWESDAAALTQVHLVPILTLIFNSFERHCFTREVAGKDIVEENISGEYYVPLAFRTKKGDGAASPYVFDQNWIDRNMEITQRFVEIMGME